MDQPLCIRVETTERGVAATLNLDPDVHAVVRLEGTVPLSGSPDGWLAPGLLLAMAVGRGLRVERVDSQALDNARQARDLLAQWFPDQLARIEIETDRPSVVVPPTTRRGVGCFFSGGVDSFYSAIERTDEITHLIFVHGFDIALANDSLRAAASRAAQEAAAELGKELIEIETDIRHVSDPHLEWGAHFHGAALALVAHGLRDHLRTIIIPATYFRDDLFPWGSHPDLDPLWSSGQLEIVHHGDDRTRPQKVASIAQHQVALDHLRVCWRNPDGAYNCGKCEKCVRTMISLQAAGALGRCRTLPGSLDMQAVRALPMDRGARIMARENIAALRASGVSDPDLQAVLRRRIRETLAHEAALRRRSRLDRARAVASRMRSLLPRRRDGK